MTAARGKQSRSRSSGARVSVTVQLSKARTGGGLVSHAEFRPGRTETGRVQSDNCRHAATVPPAAEAGSAARLGARVPRGEGPGNNEGDSEQENLMIKGPLQRAVEDRGCHRR